LIVNCRTLLIALFAVAPTVNAQLSILPGTIGKTERDQPVEIINDLVITQGDIVVNRIDRQGAGARGFGVGRWWNTIRPALRVRQALAATRAMLGQARVQMTGWFSSREAVALPGSGDVAASSRCGYHRNAASGA